METKTELKNRYEFTLLFDVENGNPNGDPDMGNMPRVDSLTGNGLVTDVCLKSKLRHYVDIRMMNKTGYDIYIKPGAVLNTMNEDAYKETKQDKSKKNNSVVTKWMCDHYFDVRAFGAVMSTGEFNSGTVRGPVQLSFSRSIDPTNAVEITITRKAITDAKKAEEANAIQTMGKKQYVPYALYRLDGYVSANLAKKTGFSVDDLNLLWDGLVNMFEHDHSAARGKLSARKLVVFKHYSELGCCPAHKLFDLIKVENVCKGDMPPRAYTDYKVTIGKDIPKGVEVQEKL